MLPYTIWWSIVAFVLEFAYRSSTPPVMYPVFVFKSIAWQKRGIGVRLGMGIKLLGWKPRIMPCVEVLPIIVIWKSWGECCTEGLSECCRGVLTFFWEGSTP